MDARFTLIHLLCAIAALAAAAAISAPAGHPRARPWLAGSLFVLGVGELYVAAVCVGLALIWPPLHAFALVWLLLPALLWRHFGERHGAPVAGLRWRHA